MNINVIRGSNDTETDSLRQHLISVQVFASSGCDIVIQQELFWKMKSVSRVEAFTKKCTVDVCVKNSETAMQQVCIISVAVQLRGNVALTTMTSGNTSA